MAPKHNSSQASTSRRSRGFEAASSLLSQRVQKAAEGRGFAVSRLLTHWQDIVGEELAQVTRPVRVSHDRGFIGATLTLLVNGSVAPMIAMRLPELRERVNACYGYNAIQKISLTQTSASGFSEGQAQFRPQGKQPPVPDQRAKDHAQFVAAQFDDQMLSEAMSKLALNLSTRLSTRIP